MRQVVIENPIINSPFDEPERHFCFSDEGITNKIADARRESEAKVATAQTLWIPAVNGHCEFGRWAFVNIADPWDAKNTIRQCLNNGKGD